MRERTGDRNDNHFSIYGLKNQSKSSTSSKNVIPVYNNGEQEIKAISRCERQDKKREPSDGGRGRSKLINLLTLLFGLQMMLSVALLPCSVQSHQQSMLHNLTTPSATTSVPKLTVKNSTASQANNSYSNSTLALINKTAEFNDGSSKKLSINLPGTTVRDSPEAATTTTASGPEESSGRDYDEDTENENSLSANENATSGEGPGRLTSALLLSTASEAAEQLIKSLKVEGGAADSSESGAAEDGPITGEQPDEETELKERRIDRRDNGEPSAVSSKQMRSIETGDMSANLTTTNTTATKTTIKSAAEELRFAMETYAKWRDTSNEILELLSRKVLPIVVEHGYDVDAVTVTGLLQLFNGIRALKPWALKVLDASAKLTPGLLVGTQSDFGDFDECINVRVDDPSGLQQANAIPVEQQEIDPQTGLPTSTVIGRYCLADIEFPKPPRVRLATRNEELQTDFAPIELRNPLLNFSQTEEFKDTIWVETANFFHMLYVDPIRVGICLTNKIDPDNFAQVLNKLTKHLEVSINFQGRCVTKYDKPVWSSYQVVSAYVLIIACSLVALCTLLDLLHAKLNKLPLPSGLDKRKFELRNSLNRYRPLFTSFSVIRNTKRLFKSQLNTFLPPSDNSSCCSTATAQRHQQYNLNLQNSMARCSTSASGAHHCLHTSSSESSPSIERRSSAGSSALNLISDTSSLATTSVTQGNNNNKLIQDCQLIGIHNSHLTVGNNGEQQRDANNLLCLHGIRVITMIWMIVNHTYLFGGFFVLWAYRRLIDIAEWPKSISFQLVLNGWLTVETYFFLSAAIIVLNVMPLMKRKRFSYLPYVLHRLLRLLPAYTGLVCLNFLWPLISSGPVWLVKGKSFIQTPCENYLWTNFLFINNWIWPEKQVSFNLQNQIEGQIFASHQTN